MPKGPQGQVSREELLEAQMKLEERILRMTTPAYLRGRNPALLARLEAALTVINDALAAPRPSHA